MSVDGMGFLFLAFRADAEEVELVVGEHIARLVLDLLVDALGVECRDVVDAAAARAADMRVVARVGIVAEGFLAELSSCASPRSQRMASAL